MTASGASAAPTPVPGISCIAVPTPFLVGTVNCYLIEDDPLTLIDTGPNSASSFDELERGIQALGHEIREIERLVITHQHMDHLGLISVLARRAEPEICVLDHLAPVIEDFSAHAERDDELAERLMLRHGVPPDVVVALRAVSRGYRAWGASAQPTRTLTEGERLTFSQRAFEVLHRPGHSP